MWELLVAAAWEAQEFIAHRYILSSSSGNVNRMACMETSMEAPQKIKNRTAI